MMTSSAKKTVEKTHDVFGFFQLEKKLFEAFGALLKNYLFEKESKKGVELLEEYYEKSLNFLQDAFSVWFKKATKEEKERLKKECGVERFKCNKKNDAKPSRRTFICICSGSIV